MKNWLNHRLSKDCFIRFNKKQYSFQNIGDTVYDRTLSLIDFGVKKGDKIALFLPEALDFIEAYLACYKIQSPSIILNHKWRQNELRNALETVPPDFIVCSYKHKSLFLEFKKPIIFIEELSKSFGSCYANEIDNSINKEAIQSILFTSGTQGFSKPVCLTYDNFYQSSIKWKKAIDLNKNDKYLLSLPLYHVSGLAIIMRSLHLGFSVNINSAPAGISDSTVFSAVPTLLTELLKDEKNINDLQKIRCIVLSGSKASQTLLAKCKKHNLNIFLSYGMTETCSSICGFWPFKEQKHNVKIVGKPFEGVKIKVINNQIFIESNTVMKKYFNGNLTNGEFATSDKGSVENNFLTLNGRLDDIVISGGENINPSEVVEAIASIAKFDKIITFKKEDPYWGEILGVYIYTNQKIDSDYIKSKLGSIISKHKIPKEIVIKKPEV